MPQVLFSRYKVTKIETELAGIVSYPSVPAEGLKQYIYL